MKDKQLSFFDRPPRNREARLKQDEKDTWDELGFPKESKEERDCILVAIRRARKELTDHAFRVAARISKEKGSVTSPEVLAELKADPEWRDLVAETDPRFMGVVFRRKGCWTRSGYVATGSHGRPVSIWHLYRDPDAPNE